MSQNAKDQLGVPGSKASPSKRKMTQQIEYLTKNFDLFWLKITCFAASYRNIQAKTQKFLTTENMRKN